MWRVYIELSWRRWVEKQSVGIQKIFEEDVLRNSVKIDAR